MPPQHAASLQSIESRVVAIVSGRGRIHVCEASFRGKVRDLVRQFVRRAACRQQLQIFDKLADADSLLASEDHARERDFGFLLLLSDPQQVGVLREQRSPPTPSLGRARRRRRACEFRLPDWSGCRGHGGAGQASRPMAHARPCETRATWSSSRFAAQQFSARQSMSAASGFHVISRGGDRGNRDC